MADSYIDVEILNWNEYQPRKDIKNPTWFACSNRILERSKLFDLTDSEWKAVFYLFCQGSQQNDRGKTRINAMHAEKVCGIKPQNLRTALNKLAYAGTISLCTDQTEGALRDRQTEQTDKTNTVCTVAKVAPAPNQVSSAEDLITNLPGEIRSLYSDDEGYVTRESIKAWAWCKDNPQKRPKSPKGFRRFFSGWLERGWDRHRKSIPSAQRASGTGGYAERDGVA